MQYLLTQTELDELRNKDFKFKALTQILHDIDQEQVDVKVKELLYKQLINELGYANQDGSEANVLSRWVNRKK
jgi:hypothetical protein